MHLLFPFSLAMTLAVPAMAQELKVVQHAERRGASLVHSGEFYAEQSFVDAGHCPAGEGRVRRQIGNVTFKTAFASPPTVIIGLTGFDFEQGRGNRPSAVAESIHRDGMTVVVMTWCNANLWSVTGNYIAVGSPEQ